MNTNQVGQNMRGERNEHSMESEMEGIRKRVYLYIGTAVQILKKRKRKWDSGTGTTLTGTTRAKSVSGHSVPVSHLLVPVPPGKF